MNRFGARAVLGCFEETIPRPSKLLQMTDPSNGILCFLSFVISMCLLNSVRE